MSNPRHIIAANMIPLSVPRDDVAKGIRQWLNDKHSVIIKEPKLYDTKAQVDLLNDLRAEISDCHKDGRFPWEPASETS